MPTYEFLNNDTGESEEHFMSYKDLDEFKANYTCEEYQDIEDWEGLMDYTHTIPICEKSFIIQNI